MVAGPDAGNVPCGERLCGCRLSWRVLLHPTRHVTWFGGCFIAARLFIGSVVGGDRGQRTGTKPARAPNQTRVHELVHPALDRADTAAEVVGERHLFDPAG